MSSLYYLGLSVMTLSMSIYNFDYHSKGGQVQCFNTLNMTLDQYLNYNSTHNKPQVTGGDPTQMFQIEVESSNGYKSLFLIIGIFFIFFFILSLYLSLVVNTLANQLPSDFINISMLKKINACLCKVFPLVFIILSWIIFVIIIIAWGFIVTNHCNVAKNNNPIKAWSLTRYYNDAVILNSINSGIWVIMHYIFALIRQLVYIEPFMYAPIISKSKSKEKGKEDCLKVVFFQYLGP